MINLSLGWQEIKISWVEKVLVLYSGLNLSQGAKRRVSMAKPAKGQLISKCPYEKSVSFKIPTKIVLDFCPEISCSFLGASW